MPSHKRERPGRKRERDELRYRHFREGFGMRLRALREAYQGHFPDENHEQARWATRIGVTPYIYNRWERGKHLPRLDFLLRITTVFQVSTEYLLRGVVGRRMPNWLRDGLLSVHPELQDEEILSDHENKAVERIRRSRSRRADKDDPTSS